MRFYFIFIGLIGFVNSLLGQKFKTSNYENLILKKDSTIQFAIFKSESQMVVSQIPTWISKNITEEKEFINFKLTDSKKDKQGYTHYYYKEFINDIRVEYAVLKFHVKTRKVNSFNGEYYLVNEVPKNGNISKEQAIHKVQLLMEEHEATPNFIEKKFIEKVYYPIENNQLVLCYKIEATSYLPTYQKYIYYISQIDNSLIKEINQVENFNSTGIAHTKYNGTKNIITDSISPNHFVLKQTGTRNIEVKSANNTLAVFTATPYTDSNNIWNIDSIAYDAYYGMEKTWDYYLNEQGRNSYDDLGTPMIGIVHYDNNLVNASGGTQYIFIGDGDGITSNPLTSTDIIGHEMTHGVTNTSAGLIYQNESGAINESFSDIFGIVVDYYANPTTANFKIGERIYNNGNYFRDMGNPKAKTQPDTYLGANWYIGSGDYGGVHTNSQVQNYWFYLLCNGGNGINDNNDSFAVSSIGMKAAADISYRALNIYLTPNSNYYDARIYTIQSAIDLFGACSQQVIEVTNAWHAVGVGSIYTNAVFAGFLANQTTFCNAPASVSFANISNNAISYLWNFGDGGTSTLSSPIHTYSNSGNYTVSLSVIGTNGCSLADTFTMSNYININNFTPLVAASCNPITLSSSGFFGITNFQLGTINNPTLNASEGYQDFSCSINTTLVAGNPYPVLVNTGYSHFVKMWIDNNNDGVFSTSELCFQSQGNFTHIGTINTSANALLNTPLRCRVIGSNAQILNACDNILNGQAEDYSITFIANTLPPIANFLVADTIVSLGSLVNFQDVSSNAPTTWQWTINGGLPINPTIQNPSSTFNTLGVFTVKLKVSNAFGTDSVTKNIHVINTFTLCGLQSSSTSLNGTLYDSGGPLGNYQNNENCYFLIQPNVNCIDSITITITQFATPSCCDDLVIIDGANYTNPNSVIYSTNQQGPITTPFTLTAYSGSIYIQFATDNSITDSGFVANWTTYQHPITAPIANFSMSNNNIPLLDTVFFTDLSTANTTAWNWNFGDGTTSTLQHPTHVYSLPGVYTVTLISTSCLAFDTVSYSLNVQASPSISLSPSSYTLAMGCNDTTNVNLYINNLAGGILNYNTQQINSPFENQLLVWTYGIDTTLKYNNLMAALNQYYTNYTLTKTSATSGADLQIALIGKKVFLVPENIFGLTGAYLSCKPVIQNFVQNGGTIIILGGQSTIYDLGILTGNNWGSVNGISTLNLINPYTPLSFGLPNTFNSINFTNIQNITNANKITVVSQLGKDVVSYVPYGNGKAIYVGYDFYNYNNFSARVISNAVKWGMQSTIGNNVLSFPFNGTLAAGNTDTVSLQISSTGFNGGLHTFYVAINSNDINNPIDTVTININVAMNPCIDFSFIQPNTCNGTIQFTDNSTNNPTSWLWNFGDGTTSILQNPSHTYLSTGTYNIKLIATNSFGTDSLSKTIIVNSITSPVATACNMPSDANTCLYCGISEFKFGTISNQTTQLTGYEDFTCTQQTVVYKGLTYPFTIVANNINPNNYSFYIDFNGDGIFAGSEIIVNNFFTYTFPFTGNITIPSNALTNTPLRIRAVSNITNHSICDTIILGQAEDYSIIVFDSLLTANFSANPLTVYVGQNVQFTDLTSGNPTAWSWQLPGSNNPSTTLQNPIVNYSAIGNYPATLIASNNINTDTFTQLNYIHVVPLPSVSFTQQFDNCDSTATFIANMPSPFTSCSWDFGDGTFIANASINISHQYQSQGTFIVKLICYSPNGNDTISSQINITFWNPTISASGTFVTGTPILFSVNSPTLITSYNWNFGNGLTSNVGNQFLNYSLPNTYIISVIVSDTLGCTKTIYDTIVISNPADVANITTDNLISIYPNPFINQITLTLNNFALVKEDIILKIIDLQGKMIKKENIKNQNQKQYVINIDEQLSSGNYLMQVYINDKMYLFKINKL